MKAILSSRRYRHMKRAGILLIAVALIAGMIGCDDAQYELTMAVNPVEGGTAIDVTGESTYPAGATVNIKAEANPGWTFAGWTSDPEGIINNGAKAETFLTMPAQDVRVTANFVAVYELAMVANPEEGGTVTDFTDASPYPKGTEVNIKAEANPGWTFAGWTSDPEGIINNGAKAETFLTMPTQDVRVTANFVAVYELAMVANPEEGGEAIDVAGLSAYPADAEVEIRAEANEGWVFADWISVPEGIIDDEAEAETFLAMPTQNVTVTANFIFFDGGSGTVENPYQITDWRHLDNIRNYLGHHFILMNDLDSDSAGYEELASVTANDGKGWHPIGTSGHRFIGTVDGQGHEISDLFIARPDESDVGLFGVVHEVGVIQNVGVVNDNVTGNNDVGGLVGKNEGSVINSYSTGSVTGNNDVGGLVGKNEGSVSNSYSTGNVTGSNDVGGLVGKTNTAAEVVNSYSASSVTGTSCVGGLVGKNDNGVVSNSYSTGSVTGSSHFGGLVGKNDNGTVSNSFYDKDTSGQNDTGKGEPKTTGEMQDITIFTAAGWDIILIQDYVDETWYIDDGNDYPRLGWQY